MTSRYERANGAFAAEPPGGSTSAARPSGTKGSAMGTTRRRSPPAAPRLRPASLEVAARGCARGCGRVVCKACVVCIARAAHTGVCGILPFGAPPAAAAASAAAFSASSRLCL